MEGPSQSLPWLPIRKAPLCGVFLYLTKRLARFRTRCIAPGFDYRAGTAREDVDEGDARQGEGQGWPESIPPEIPEKSPASRGFFVSGEEVGKIQNPVQSTRVRLPGRDSPGRRRRRRRPLGRGPWRARVNPSLSTIQSVVPAVIYRQE